MSAEEAGAWDVVRSISAIRDVAAKGECLTYGQLAQANGFMRWDAKIRSACFRHLADVCSAAHPEANAMISAVVVNSENLKSRMLTEFALAGFIRCARGLGFDTGTDDKQFLAQQQAATFRWASGASA